MDAPFTARWARETSTVLLAAALASCAVGPDFHKAAPPAAAAYLPEPLPAETVSAIGTAGAAQRFIAGKDADQEWWHAYGSMELDALISAALKANPSVLAAQASLRQAQELAAAQRGNYWPQLSGDAAAVRQRDAVGVLSPTLTSGTAVFNLFTPQLTVSFVPDLFGANRRQVESLVAAADAARFELDATYISLIDNIIVAAVQEAGLRAQIEASERVIALDRDALRILQRALDLGAVSQAEVSAQDTALAQAEAALPPLRHQLEVQRHLLAALTGHLPSDAQSFTITLDQLQLPAEIPLGVPSSLVERRPDVRAAEAQLHAATAQVGVAEANMFPQLTITGGVGSTATQVADLFKAGTDFWSIGGDLSQTLFAGGTLLHKKRAAVAALDAAGATYRSTVLGAFQNVADALHAVSTDAEVLEASVRSANAAERSFQIARRQLELGSIDYAALMLAEQAFQQTRITLIVSEVNRYADTAALFQALGGVGASELKP
jgi:NodT family efflux transporter outer membrane factor (OMF) lipoprotein